MGSKELLRIAITTGDPDGIGLEVTLSALKKIGPKRGVQFLLFRNSSQKPISLPMFKRVDVNTIEEVLVGNFDHREIMDIQSRLSAPVWVQQVAQACQQGLVDALVTAPLSKTLIESSGIDAIGHTEILQKVTGQSDLFMGFWGDKFSVVLATGHIQFKSVSTKLNRKSLSRAIAAADSLRRLLPSNVKRKPMALVGLNPHAGEEGIIGREEKWMNRLVNHHNKTGHHIVGPLVPDTAFLPSNWDRYSVYVCPYHDQGLIPFKMVHGFKSGVHLTLGLPFVRTSVDHGTAKDIYGKGTAESGSMREAILAAIKLAKGV